MDRSRLKPMTEAGWRHSSLWNQLQEQISPSFRPHVCSDIRTATEPRVYTYNVYKLGFIALKGWQYNSFWKILAILHNMDEILTKPLFEVQLYVNQ